MKNAPNIISIKCKISNTTNTELLDKYFYNWTGAYHRVFSDMAKGTKTDLTYRNTISDKFNLRAKEIEHLIIQVKQRIEQCKTNLDKITKKRETLQKNIVENYNLSDIEKYPKHRKSINYYRNLKKLSRLDKQVDYFKNNTYGIVFGGKDKLVRIAYLSNLKNLKTKEDWTKFAVRELRRNQPNRILNDKDIYQKVLDLKIDYSKLPQLKEEYKNQRTIPYYSVGNSGTSGGKNNCNIYLNLDLLNKICTFKAPKKEESIITFISNDKRLVLLDEANKNKQLPITVTLSKEYIIFSFETFKLYNKISKVDKKDGANTGNVVKEEIKQIYSKRNDKYYASIDLNPQEIGLSILKKVSDNEFKVIKAYNFSLRNIKLPIGVKSTSLKYKKTTNILKNEQGLIVKKLIDICNYYNVKHFIMDNLEKLDGKGSSTRNKRINRLFTQVWHKNRIKHLIEKRCDMYGINYNNFIWNAYSSIIGNINYPHYDSVNASIELGHRAMAKGDNKIETKNYYQLNDSDKENIKAFLYTKNNKSGTQCDVSITEDFNSWIDFNKYLKKQDFQTSYRKKDVACCDHGSIGYKTKSRMEKFTPKNSLYPIKKLFSSRKNEDNSQIPNTLK